MKRFVAIFLIVIFAFTLPARAAIFYGDIAGNIEGSGYGVGTGVNTYIAEGFTMTGTYNLQSVDVLLSLFSPASGSNLALSIFNDNGGTPGSNDLYDLSTNVSGSTGAPADANFTGSGSFSLNSGTTYWLEMYATNPSSPTGTNVQWDGEYAQVTPTTVFATPAGPGATEVGQIRTYSGGVNTSELRTAFQLNGVAAPEPSTIALLALGSIGLLVARRLR